MKHKISTRFSVGLFIIVLPLLFQCSEDNDIINSTNVAKEVSPAAIYPEVAVKVKNISATQLITKVVSLHRGDQDFKSSAIVYSTNQNFEPSTEVEIPLNKYTDSVSYRVKDLNIEQTYYFKVKLNLADTVIYSSTVEAKTLAKHTFIEIEPNPAVNRLSKLNPQPSFTHNGKGYIFRGGDGETPHLTGYDPTTDRWSNKKIQNAVFDVEASSARSMFSFSANGNHFVGLGYTLSEKDDEIGRSIFKVNLSTGSVTEYTKFLNPGVYRYSVATYNDRVFTFSFNGDSISVHEFDYANKQWLYKASTKITIAKSMLFCQAIGNTIYMMAENFGGTQTIYEYDISSGTLSRPEATHRTQIIPKAERHSFIDARHSFIFEGKVYFTAFVINDTRDLEKQYLASFDPLTSTVEKIVEFSEFYASGLPHAIAMAFMIDNIIYIETYGQRCFMIEL